MSKRSPFGRQAGAVALVVILALGFGATAVSAAPPNDNFADAAIIAGLPYSDTADTSTATAELPNETFPCDQPSQSVWYAYTPASDGLLTASAAGASPNYPLADLTIWTGPGLFALQMLQCGVNNPAITFPASAGTTYYFQVSTSSSSFPGPVTLQLQELVPPANDNLANATAVSSLPFTTTVDNSNATSEAGEIQACNYVAQTVWYSFTPLLSGWLAASAMSTNPVAADLAIWKAVGPGFGGLQYVLCGTPNASLTFLAEAGATYYFQVSTSTLSPAGPVTLSVASAPPPAVIASFSYSPSDPDKYDSVTFCDQSYDPAGAGIVNRSWKFGDGATASNNDNCTLHQFTKDGAYSVALQVTTTDGRTTSITQTVPVSTHDVAITKFTVPTSASAGQTRTINVGLRNYNYSESVRVDLYKSDLSAPDGWSAIASSIQQVPVRSGNRTTDFASNYTFTKADAALGKVTFKAIATIQNARDALPADNTAISLPVKINK